MTATLVLQAIETTAIIIGVAFGLFQLNQIRIQREVQSGAELMRSLHSIEVARIAVRLAEIPDDLSEAQLRETLGDDFESIARLMFVFEGIGPLVARGHIPIQIYSDFYRGATVLFWGKLRRYIEDKRTAGWTIFMEWFQWLAERMDDSAFADEQIPAHLRYADWQSPSDFNKLRRTSKRDANL